MPKIQKDQSLRNLAIYFKATLYIPIIRVFYDKYTEGRDRYQHIMSQLAFSQFAVHGYGEISNIDDRKMQ